MKNLKNTALIVFVLFSIMLTSCKKTGTNPDYLGLAISVNGTYTGELKNSQTNQSVPATLNVTILNDSTISMHCVTSDFDTTMNMMLYQNEDSIMMCYTGQDFYNEYGRNLDNHNFCNSKATTWNSGWEDNHDNWWGDQNNMWNAWNNHMNSQHKPGDQHYGGFDPNNQTCDYSFKVNSGNLTYYEIFNGVIK